MNSFIIRQTLFSALLLLASLSAASQTPSPMPSPVQVPQQPANGKLTLESLRTRIAERLMRPEVRRGQVGVKVVTLNSGKVLFESNADKYFMPASNMKNFTVAAALEKLTPDHRIVTSVLASASPDANGVVKGLRIFGRGDISLSYTFLATSPDDPDRFFRGVDKLVDLIVSSGVKRVEGDLIADETYFTGNAVPGSWEWDDLQAYYGAEISALPLNDNVISVSVTAGPVGFPCTVKMMPFNFVYRVTNLCTTTAAGTARTLRIEKKIDRNILEISGDLPVGNSGYSGFISVSRPAELFVSLLKQRLELKGITVTGQTRAVNKKTAVPAQMTVEIAKLESPPMSAIAARTMKPSQNMYTETLLWILGEDHRVKMTVNGTPGPVGDSSDLGITAVKLFLKEIGVAEDGIIQHDGSGLSRHNLITPDAVVRLYTYMGRESRFSQAWRDSLTIGGVDGTLRNRFVGTKALGNVRGKTGTIDQVSALSGYVTTAAGEQLVFSIVVNGVNEVRNRTGLIDDIAVHLANFDGRID